VLVPTYQHHDFIEGCLNSIISQHTNFHFEVLVGEDESSDGTRAICERYAAAHPDRIRLFLRSRKDVMHILGRPTGRANLLHLLSEARGTYIALCEGDDMWVDPLKLQRQVDALEGRPDAMGCFTNVYNDAKGVRTPYFGPGASPEPSAEVDQRSLVLGQGVPTCSFLFRRAELPTIPPELYAAPVADTLLFSYLSRNGPLLYLPILAGVRHVHPGGINSMKSRAHKMNVMLHTFPHLDGITAGRFSKELSDRRRKELLMHWDRAMREGDLEMARVCWRPLAEMRGQIGWNLTTTIRNYLKAWHPAWDRMVARLRGS
jgi:glycosyltransferase involved in cell wall biosynthesis